MRATGFSGQSEPSRRRLLRSLFGGAVITIRLHQHPAAAQPASPVPSQVPDLDQHFPDDDELPAGLQLESSGVRQDVAQLTGTFRNSRDAAQLLTSWGWLRNAYRSYVPREDAGPATPARVEISLHQFTSSTGAAYALAYFAHDRAVAFQHREGLGEFLLPCEAMVIGDGSATRFLRRRNVVVRVTVVMPIPLAADADTRALTSATDIALAVLANAGGLGPERHTSC